MSWFDGPFKDTDGSLLAANWRALRDAGTLHNTAEQFPVGTRVRIVCLCQDFSFFHGERGVVTKCDPDQRYYALEVRFDPPRRFVDGSVQTHFGFHPSDVSPIEVTKREPVAR